jgi:hypothetical protein
MDGHPEALIDLSAIKENVAALRRHIGGPQLMAVVKADGYGHGMVQTATAAVAGGADWLGVVQTGDALALRRAGLTVPVLCLLAAPDAPHEEAVRQGIDLSAGSVAVVGQIAVAAQRAGRLARPDLKADTGMFRGGATAEDWPALVSAALAAEAAGQVRSPESGRTSPARTSPGTPRSTGSWRRSAAPLRWPSGPAPGPRCVTSPTPRQPSRCPTRGSTWSGPAVPWSACPLCPATCRTGCARP